MEDLTKHLEVVLEHVKVSQFYGFGCGMGSYVLLDFASKYPQRLKALILINPTAEKSWYFDWFYEKCNIFANNYVKYDRWWVEQFTRRWFHRSTLQENLPLLELHEKLFFRMNQKNVENIQRAFTLRRDIRSDLDKIKCRTIILAADGGLTENEAVAVMAAMKNNPDCSWVKIGYSGVLLPAESPRLILHPINLFLYGSIGTKITKEMLEFSRQVQLEGER
mmetsp:Transcript_13538/g.18754  ORF Transcript_13538/g.18754 Transcript_13538/m.18754 type:complete len:221 (+) Transcript_13538:415-1077(+)